MFKRWGLATWRMAMGSGRYSLLGSCALPLARPEPGRAPAAAAGGGGAAAAPFGAAAACASMRVVSCLCVRRHAACSRVVSMAAKIKRQLTRQHGPAASRVHDMCECHQLIGLELLVVQRTCMAGGRGVPPAGWGAIAMEAPFSWNFVAAALPQMSQWNLRKAISSAS